MNNVSQLIHSRRYTLLGGDPVARIRNSFKDRIAADSGIFEAESCLDSEITRLRNLGLYDKASLIITPNGYKTSKLYALKPDSGGDLTFTRASTAMRRNSAGLWESVANNVPRLSYPVGGGCPVILNENQRTNVVPRSSPTSDTWTSAGGASLANEVMLTPIASVTSALKINTISSAFSGAYVAQSGASANYTAWAFVKKGTLNFASLFNAEASINAAWFNIDNGTLGTVTAGYTAGIENAGNGWYLIWINKNTNEIAQFFQIMFTDTNGSSTGAIGHSFISHAQTEVGDNPTSPILTSGGAITRIADLPTLTGVSNLIGQTEGVLFWEGSTINGMGTDLMIIGTLTNSVFIAINSSRQIQLGIRANNSLVVNLISSPIASTNNMKISAAYKSGDIIVYCNGLAVITSTLTYSFSAPISELEFGRSFYEAKSIQTLNKGLLFKSRLPNTELATL